MRKAGYPRPTCEECGLVELVSENQLIWDVFQNYEYIAFNFYGNGAWNINTAGMKYLAKRFEIDMETLVDRLLILAKVIYRPNPVEGKSDGNGN